MDYWPQPSIPPVKGEDEEMSRSFRILAVTSGNVPAYGLDAKPGIETQNPASNTTVKQDSSKSAASQTTSLDFASPKNHQANLSHLRSRIQRRETGRRHGIRPQFNPPRPYLTCEKYLAYKNRERLELGKDGIPVWDSVTEEAFQDALVQIIPMGRKKMTQRGKLFGRNELIGKYILEKIGVVRNRKQVSSHVQVLNKLLRGIPEWDAVIQAIDDKNNPNNHRYCEISIRDMVRGGSHASTLTYPLHSSSTGDRHLPPPSFTLGSNTDHAEKHVVTQLNFVMWVSPPNPTPPQMTDQLHRYTEVQCRDSSSKPVPLENTKNWRLSFPHLPSMVEHGPLSQSCDLLLLEASFQLMPDFPPPMCKLGIYLELDFRHPMADMKALTEIHGWKWSCVTRLYDHGKCFQQTHHHCDLTGKKMEIGKVAPLFESKYWAEKFVDLIEKKRDAEESGSEAAISAANENSCNFFNGLSAMQELVAYAPAEVPLLETPSKPPQGKRMAILLWKFRQAQFGHVGVTTWQRLIPPPPRNTLNSPPSVHNLLPLPPLSMDGMMDAMHVDPNFPIYDEAQSQYSNHIPNHFSEINFEEGTESMDHDGYDVDLRDEHLSNLTSMHSWYDVSSSQQDLSQSSFPGLEVLPFDYSSQPTIVAEHHTELQSTDNSLGSQADHHASQYKESASTLLMALPAYRGPGILRPDTGLDHEARRQPLSDFDRNTHNVLQAQLEQSEARDPDADERALQAALAAAPAMNGLGATNRTHFLHAYSQPHSHSHLHRPQPPPPQHFQKQEDPWEAPFMSPSPLPLYACYPTQHSHQQAPSEHLRVTLDQEALEVNQLAPALRVCTSSFGAYDKEFPNHEDNTNASVSQNGDCNLPIDFAVAFAEEIASTAENEQSPQP